MVSGHCGGGGERWLVSEYSGGELQDLLMFPLICIHNLL